MWFSLFAVVLVLAVTFYQGLHGLFSAMIMCLLTMLSAALAFGVYEDVYMAFLLDRQPDHGRAIALVGIFAVSLLIFRSIADALIKTDMHFQIYVDRTLGGLFGFVTAMTVIGVMCVGWQMLPFGERILGFQRYTLVDTASSKIIQPPTGDKEADKDIIDPGTVDWSQVKQTSNSLMLSPDKFAVSLASFLTSNSLRGANPQSFAEAHPNFLEQWHHLRANPYGQNQIVAKPGAVKIEGFWDYKGKLFTREIVERNRVMIKPGSDTPEPGYRWWAARLSFTHDATEKGTLRFTTKQLRLIPETSKPGQPLQYHPVGMSDPYHPSSYLRIYETQAFAIKPEGGQLTFDFVFEVPEGTDFEPWYIEFKQNARAEVEPGLDRNEEPLAPLKGPEIKQPEVAQRPPVVQNQAPPPTPVANASPEPVAPQQNVNRPPAVAQHQQDQPRGRVHGVDVSRNDPIFSEYLPFAISKYGGSAIEAGSNGLRGGRLVAELDDNWEPVEGDRPPIDKFDVPNDVRMLQLFVDKLDPQSWLGGLLGGAVDAVSNIGLKLEGESELLPVGAYAIADIGNRKVIDLIYLDEIARDMARLPKFQRVRPSHLKGEYSYVYLFLVPPGSKPTTLITGRKHLDLRHFNLVAPQ